MNLSALIPDSLEQRVINLITEHQRLQPGQVSIDSTFANLGVDSFDCRELLHEFEQAFDLSIPHDTGSYVKSVRDAVEVLREMLAAPAPA